ncbi:MAG: DUF1801 domain-containing protein [Rhodobacteraceae bacterium]|nr:MAG: DUF1801 domain-containing protein [Paracoccaceae bacterium]
MRVNPRLGSYDEIAAQASDVLRQVDAPRKLAHELHPDGVETASRKERSISWGFEGGKMQYWYAYAMPHKAHINLGLSHGVDLPDPEDMLKGNGKRLRHVKLRDPAAAMAPAVRALMIAAHKERRAALTT